VRRASVLVALLSLPLAAASAQVAPTEDVLAHLRAAHRERPTDPQVALDLGLVLYQRDNASPEARQLLKEAATRFPKRHDVQIALLDSTLAGGDHAAATALLERLGADLDSDERYALDVTYCLLGRRLFQEASVQWNRAARRVQASLHDASGKTLTPGEDKELQHRVAEVLFVQGLLTARLGEKEEALRLLRQADGFGFPPLDSPLMMAAADCLQELGEHSMATEAYRQLVAHAPKNAEARLRLGGALLSTGKAKAAQEEVERLLREAPDYPQANLLLGTALLEQKKPDEARAPLQKELERDPRCTLCMARLAYLSYLKGDDARCRSWLEKAEALRPDDPETNLVFGLLENRAGRYDQAIQRLTRVVERTPADARAQYQLAIAYQRSGNAQKAREHLELYDKLIQEEKARTIGVRGS
jgi:Flp pilus assembly protein TadD